MSVLSLQCMLSMCVSKDIILRMVMCKSIVASFLQCLVAFLGFHLYIYMFSVTYLCCLGGKGVVV